MKKFFSTFLIIFTAIPAYAILENTTNFFIQILLIFRDRIVPLAWFAALFFFFWGVAKYIRSEGNDKAAARPILWWGVVALFVISTVWGLVLFIVQEFGITPLPSVEIPSATYGS